MPLDNVMYRVKSLGSLFAAKSLTKKASLNAVASGLDYVGTLLVGLLTTPLMVANLGNYYYGVWQVMNRIFSYLSTIGGTTSPLEWTIAKDQTSADYAQKRAFVGSAVITWALLLPLILIGGGIITLFSPTWLKAPAEGIGIVRIVAILFMVSQALISLAFLPASILRGQNQGYRRLGLSLILAAANGLMIWLALSLKTGIIGVTVVSILYLFLYAAFYIIICKKYIPWFGINRPTKDMVVHFLKLSGLFFVNDMVMNINIASDVVILGLLGTVESVTSYTLNKYVPETMISMISIVVMGIIPGLGGIIGSGDLKKAVQLRGEIFSLTWLVVTVVSTCILVWNRTFLTLWIGADRYVGPLANLLITLVVIQYVIYKVDNSIIDLSLHIERKVLMAAASAVVSIIIACVLVGVFKMGIIGISLGLLTGRLLLTFSYPAIASRYLGISFWGQLKQIIRPALAMAIMFAITFLLDDLMKPVVLSGFRGWLLMGVGVIISVVFFFFLAYFMGFTSDQRSRVKSRISSLISK